MRTLFPRLPIALFPLCVFLLAPTMRAQSYSGYFDGADCQSLRGWASDGNINDAVSVDLFDGANPTPFGTYPANQFRPDLSASYGWSLATPPPLTTGRPIRSTFACTAVAAS